MLYYFVVIDTGGCFHGRSRHALCHHVHLARHHGPGPRGHGTHGRRIQGLVVGAQNHVPSSSVDGAAPRPAHRESGQISVAPDLQSSTAEKTQTVNPVHLLPYPCIRGGLFFIYTHSPLDDSIDFRYIGPIKT